MNKHVTFVIFGGTGDLTKRKLVPAFADLLRDGVLTKDSSIVGIARGDFTDETYRELLLSATRSKAERDMISKVGIHFFRADSSKPGSLRPLKKLLTTFEHKNGCDRIFYLATGYKLFPLIVDNLKDAGLDKQKDHFTRIVFEKPFGYDYKSAAKLERQIHSVFTEDQIYRIDHYLGKETVQNINIFKFTNPFIHHILSGTFVDKIDIIADENLSVGERLGYYDGAGAIKDMLQSHLLQVASLILMDQPSELEAERIHDKKVAVLKKLELLPASKQVIGQYETYAKELKQIGLPNSRTETFCRIGFTCNMKRWQGTKIFLQTGKMLNRKYGQIVIHFKDVPLMHGLEGVKENKLVIDIHPDQDIRFFFNTRRPYTANQIAQVALDFCGSCHFGPNTTDGYKRLINDVIIGDKTLFTRNDELLLSWKIVDKITEQKSKFTFITYKNKSDPRDFL